MVDNSTKMFYSVQWKNQQYKHVESTVKGDILCCQCENSSEDA